jgi:hypothetical protein
MSYQGARRKLAATASMPPLSSVGANRVNRWLLDHYRKASPQFDTYTHRYFLDVLYRMNTAAADQVVLDLMRERWASMSTGETRTTWETFEPGERRHNWGAALTYFLSKYVLGVRVDEPVSKRWILIEPRLADLRHVEGTVVTELGRVPVRWEKTDDDKKLTFEMEVPPDAKAKVHLPQLGNAAFVVLDNQPIALTNTANGFKIRRWDDFS